MRFVMPVFVLLLIGLAFSANAVSCSSVLKAFGNKLALPSSVSSFFSGESVNLAFPSNPLTEEIRVNGKVGNNGLENLKCGTDPNAGYDLYISYNAALELSKSKNPVQSFMKYMKNGEIRITAHGVVPSIKLALAKAAFGFYN